MAFSTAIFRFKSHIFAFIRRLLNFSTGKRDKVSYPTVALYKSLLQLESGDNETWKTDVSVRIPPITTSTFSSLNNCEKTDMLWIQERICPQYVTQLCHEKIRSLCRKTVNCGRKNWLLHRPTKTIVESTFCALNKKSGLFRTNKINHSEKVSFTKILSTISHTVSKSHKNLFEIIKKGHFF